MCRVSQQDTVWFLCNIFIQTLESYESEILTHIIMRQVVQGCQRAFGLRVGTPMTYGRQDSNIEIFSRDVRIC
jgi:hypothetical protein